MAPFLSTMLWHLTPSEYWNRNVRLGEAAIGPERTGQFCAGNPGGGLGHGIGASIGAVAESLSNRICVNLNLMETCSTL